MPRYEGAVATSVEGLTGNIRKEISSHQYDRHVVDFRKINHLCRDTVAISCLLGRRLSGLVQGALLRNVDFSLSLGKLGLLLISKIGQKIDWLAKLDTAMESTDDAIRVVNGD